MAHESTSARALLLRVRRMADLTQRELATAAGVTHGVVSRYESRRQQPTLQALERLVDAAGLELVWDLRHRDPDDHDGELRGPVGRRLRTHRAEVLATLGRHGFVHPRVVGPVARSQEHPHCLLVLVVDLAEAVAPTQTGVPGWARPKMVASGAIQAIAGEAVQILLSEEASLEGYTDAEAVAL